MGTNDLRMLNEQDEYINLASTHFWLFLERFYVFKSQNMD